MQKTVMKVSMRDYYSSEITEDLLGKTIKVCGWVHRRRDHGGVIFLDIRDREGLVQLLIEPENETYFPIADHVRHEYVIFAEGTVRLRPKGQSNANLKSGNVEILCDEIKVLNASETVPFQIDEHQKVGEEVRLRYRYIDLRRDQMQHNLKVRAKMTRFIRGFLDDHGFLDIETPVLTKATPEGARDYLVPSRVHPGAFYALPQSPQLFKQLLMVSGFDRYYQIVRCFRDEDLRAERQPEFTQIDIEASFLDEGAIMHCAETMIRQMFEEVKGIALPEKFAVLSYAEAMRLYGSDKPDTRIPLQFVDVADLLKEENFQVFAKPAKDPASRVIAMCVKEGNQKLTRKMIDEYTRYVSHYGARGLAYIKVNQLDQGKEGLQSPIVKNLSEAALMEILKRTKAQVGDLIFFAADKVEIANASLSALRHKLGEDLSLYDSDWSALWVVDFPMFEKKEGRYHALHHPFTMPNHTLDELKDLAPENLLSRAYDMVINGYEVGGGSIRIHDTEMQKYVFKLLGIEADEAEEKFGFLLNALKYGAPPHGGIAFGLDRLAMLMCQTANIRDVIAFPKTQSAQCLLTSAPSGVSLEQLDELKLMIQLDVDSCS